MDVHELTAAYALDALEPGEHEHYESHLATCEPCRAELAELWQVTGALARGAGGPAPPPSLRERILDQARSERTNVVPLRRRYLVPVLSSAAAVAAVLAIAFGLWGASLSNELDQVEREQAVLTDPNAQAFETSGGEGSLVVTPAGDAALVVRTLAPAPEGSDYQIWVFEDGTPRGAGVFEEPGVAMLSRQVRPGQQVAVTLERDGGVDAPTSDPLFTTAAT